MSEDDKKVVSEKLELFLNKYSTKYDEQTLKYIKQNFWGSIDNTFSDSILFQVYSELGIYNNEFYLQHLNKLKQNFDIRCDILDVASGTIPIFGNLLAKEQLKLNCGSITLYDPKLIIGMAKYKNISCNIQKFNLNVDVSKYKLITGIFPCEITEDIILSACMNKKDFYIALCGCDHFVSDYDEYMFLDAPPYEDYIINRARNLVKEHNNGILVIDRLDNNSLLNYPILYNKRK